MERDLIDSIYEASVLPELWPEVLTQINNDIGPRGLHPNHRRRHVSAVGELPEHRVSRRRIF